MSNLQYRSKKSSDHFYTSYKYSFLDIRKSDSPVLLQLNDKSERSSQRMSFSPEYNKRKSRFSIVQKKQAFISLKTPKLEFRTKVEVKNNSRSHKRNSKSRSPKRAYTPISKQMFPDGKLNLQIFNTSKFTRVCYSPLENQERLKRRINIKIDNIISYSEPNEDIFP